MYGMVFENLGLVKWPGLPGAVPLGPAGGGLAVPRALCGRLRSVAGYFGLALVFVGDGDRGRGLIAIFRDSFASTSKIFNLVGAWALSYHSMRFRHFPSIS